MIITPRASSATDHFRRMKGLRVGIAESADVIIEKKVGNGKIIVTSIHEYPSRAFLKNICMYGNRKFILK